MIAPLRQTEPETNDRRQRLRRARQVVASTLLGARRISVCPAPAVPAWQAWLFAAWVVGVVAAYLSSMLHWW